MENLKDDSIDSLYDNGTAYMVPNEEDEKDPSISFVKRDPLEVLSWTLNFLYEDLDPDHWNDVEKQKLLLDVYSYLMKRFSESLAVSWKTLEFRNADPIKIQAVLRDHFETHFLPLIKGERDRSSGWTRPIIKETEIYYRSDEGLQGPDVILERLDIERLAPEYDAVTNFRVAIKALSKHSLLFDTFQWCEGCKKIFIPYGKGARKKRRFCSHACNMRHNSKVRRKKAK